MGFYPMSCESESPLTDVSLDFTRLHVIILLRILSLIRMGDPRGRPQCDQCLDIVGEHKARPYDFDAWH